ncbi:diaminopimelate epimerase [Sinanaerobacter chloroacetimidivorans]|uniref:Diaminopimelate epimerase n=1 Tax=Sinanaerobacter chloroacetimidivorans TaxID=2818044 RepID=A0A8J7W4T2_9FIRM|nr:diaminopimelate epimerase [Sinanaerobacter chloroacetimidivorans]MBR0598940.1 diaminopimelate epimerase [Sinanaerobacter chloroacetimidivorans]
MISFSKYHGCGNDFIILKEQNASGYSYPELARAICHRTLGIGADGLIIVKEAPLEMIFYNSDGSRAPMCGNGIRCFAKYCYDEGITKDADYEVVTLAGIMGVHVAGLDPFLVEINMGKPDFDPVKSAIRTDLDRFLKQDLDVNGQRVQVSSCFMGTVHTVLWLEDYADTADLESLGREISHHPVYAEQTNVNMVQVIDKNTLKLTTYERGAGMTYACGTGACASVVIGALEGRCEKEANVLLPYGTLHIKQIENDEVFMTGPAVKIGQGSYIGENT